MCWISTIHHTSFSLSYSIFVNRTIRTGDLSLSFNTKLQVMAAVSYYLQASSTCKLSCSCWCFWQWKNWYLCLLSTSFMWPIINMKKENTSLNKIWPTNGTQIPRSCFHWTSLNVSGLLPPYFEVKLGKTSTHTDFTRWCVCTKIMICECGSGRGNSLLKNI